MWCVVNVDNSINCVWMMHKHCLSFRLNCVVEMIKHKQEWIIIIVLFIILSILLNLHLLFILFSFCIKVLFHNFDKELLVQIIILVFTWKNFVSSIKMTCAWFMMTSKTWKINKVDDKADDKADDVSKICNAYSEFL